MPLWDSRSCNCVRLAPHSAQDDKISVSVTALLTVNSALTVRRTHPSAELRSAGQPRRLSPHRHRCALRQFPCAI